MRYLVTLLKKLKLQEISLHLLANMLKDRFALFFLQITVKRNFNINVMPETAKAPVFRKSLARFKEAMASVILYCR